MSLLSYNLTRKRGGGGNCGYGWTAKIVTLTKKRKKEGKKKESGWRQLAALDFTSSSSAGSSPRSSFSTSSRGEFLPFISVALSLLAHKEGIEGEEKRKGKNATGQKAAIPLSPSLIPIPLSWQEGRGSNFVIYQAIFGGFLRLQTAAAAASPLE